MKRLIATCVILAMMVTTFVNAQTVLTFDDITTNVFFEIWDGYGGLDWGEFWIIHKDYFVDDGYENGTVSGDYVALNYHERVATVNDGLFRFDGAYLTAAWHEDLNIDIDGYRDGSPVASTTVTVDPWGPTWFDFGWVVDELVFTAYGGTDAGLDAVGEYFAMDNFTFSTEIEVEFEVAIDIKPTSCPNPLNVGSRGVLPVAIVGTEDFDVAIVDPASVKLIGVPPLRWSLEDVCTPFEPLLGKESEFDCTEEGPDGYLDLTLKFDIQEIVEALGEVDDGDVLALLLEGNLLEEHSGTPIVGEDVVIIMKKGK